MSKYSSYKQQQLLTEAWRSFAIVEQQPIAPEQGTTKGAYNPIVGSVETYEDLNKVVKTAIETKKWDGLKKVGIDIASQGLKSVFDLYQMLGKLPDNKKTGTFLDKLNVDDQFSAIVDDKIENQFMNDLSQAFATKSGPLPNNFNINKELQNFIARKYEKRTVATITEQTTEYDDAVLDDGTLVCAGCLQELLESDRNIIQEAKYQGRTVTLNKPTKGDVKKFKVYVKDPSTGNVKKVNFGDPNMKIKKNIPARRKSFRARHNCDNPGPKTKARYWSCKKW